ncbi:hypothetical protein EAO75_09275 [Streptomyces sp. uw30]|nr:hypothetical protein EAO75_09275 [Streptomyces sp. uw30]
MPAVTPLRFGYGTNGLADLRLDDALALLADLGYDGVGLTLDHMHLDPLAPDLRPHRPLLAGEEDDNAAHRKVRARVEHVIGRMKNYKILRDCRQRGDGLHHAVQAVAHMHNLALAS